MLSFVIDVLSLGFAGFTYFQFALKRGHFHLSDIEDIIICQRHKSS
jgi:hypothetical protein